LCILSTPIGRRHAIISVEELHRRVKAVQFSDRQNYRTLANKIGASGATLHLSVKMGKLLWTTSSIKPFLTDANKKGKC
jgi:hypothetical protein